MAKKDFKGHNVGEAHKNLKLQKENGIELRKSHFKFGCDNLTFQMESAGKVGGCVQTSEKKKFGQIGSMAGSRKNNFEVGQNGLGSSDLFHYETISGQ